jgi:Xaa-Pro aminopeptidase
MVLAMEVPYDVHGLGGFSPEDILVVKEEGIELFSHAPAELPVVG